MRRRKRTSKRQKANLRLSISPTDCTSPARSLALLMSVAALLFVIAAAYMTLHLASNAGLLSPRFYSLLAPLLPFALPLYLAARMNAKFRYYGRLMLYCTTLGLTSVWAVALSVAMSLVGQSSSIQHYVARSFYYFASPVLGWKMRVEGEEYLKTDRPVVFIGNHQS